MESSSSPSPGSASSASGEVEDWSPAKWAYYEEACHNILLPDWDDLTVGERREWEGMFEKMADGKKNERMGREKAKLVEEQGVRMGSKRRRGRAEHREGAEDGEDGEDGEEQDGGHGFELGVDGVTENAPATNNHNRKHNGKSKQLTTEPTTEEIEPTDMSLGRGSRKAKLQGDSKRREQMLEETSAQVDEYEYGNEDEDEHPYPQPQPQRRARNRQRARLGVEEYHPPHVQRRQAPSIFTDTGPVPAAQKSKIDFVKQNQDQYQRHGKQSDQGAFTAEVPVSRAGQATISNWNVAGSVPAPVPARVYVSPYPALPARGPGKGDVGVEAGGEEQLGGLGGV